MGTMSWILDYYGKEMVPQFFEYYASIGLIETMNILREETESDGAGGMIKTGSRIVNDQPVPCTVVANRRDGFKGTQSDKQQTFAPFIITFPLICYNEPVSVLPSDRLCVLAREMAPERLFRIIAPKNKGATYEFYVEMEDSV